MKKFIPLMMFLSFFSFIPDIFADADTINVPTINASNGTGMPQPPAATHTDYGTQRTFTGLFVGINLFNNQNTYYFYYITPYAWWPNFICSGDCTTPNEQIIIYTNSALFAYCDTAGANCSGGYMDPWVRGFSIDEVRYSTFPIYTSSGQLFRSADGVSSTCNFWTYSDWNACQEDNMQTRTIASSSPDGCSGGLPILSRSCTYDPQLTVSREPEAGGGIASSGDAIQCCLLYTSD